MSLKSIRVKEETLKKFREFGNRTQTDDDILSAMIDLADRIICQRTVKLASFNDIRDLENILMGNAYMNTPEWKAKYGIP